MAAELIVEVPHAIILLINSVNDNFYHDVYQYIRHAVLFISVINKFFGLLIYYILSDIFRKSLKNAILHCFRTRKEAVVANRLDVIPSIRKPS